MVSWLLKKRKGTDVNAICFSNCYGRRRVGSVLFTLMLITHLNLTSVEYTMFSYTYFSFAVPPWWWVYYRFPFVKCEKLKLMLVFFFFSRKTRRLLFRVLLYNNHILCVTKVVSRINLSIIRRRVSKNLGWHSLQLHVTM